MIRSAKMVAVGSLLLLAACGSGGSPATGGAPAGGASSAVATEYAVGQPMKASDGHTVTVLSFKRNFSTGDTFDVPKAGREFVQVTYTLVNGSTTEWSGPLFELNLIDSNGQKYQSTFVTTGSDDVSSIAAGGHVPTASQVYEVPSGGSLDVVWTPNLFESTTYQTALK